jgi:GNAT superfamily N-acetyltransferase
VRDAGGAAKDTHGAGDTPPAIVEAATPEQIAAVQVLFREYMAWTTTLGFDAGRTPTFHEFDAEVASLPGIYAPPAGRLLLATSRGEPVGCVALKPHDATTGELKRLYVRPAARGRRVGWHLTVRLLDEARRAGYRRIVLDSHVSMRQAHRVYRGLGFVEVPPPEGFPTWLRPLVVFMECALG